MRHTQLPPKSVSFVTLLLCLVLSRISLYAQNDGASTPRKSPAIQWNFSGHHTQGGKTVDWIYAILPTDRKEYIAVGYTTKPVGSTGNSYKPVIMKLDKLGRLIWIRPITDAQEVGGSAVYDGMNGFGQFQQVIKTPGGYMAGGTVYRSTPPPGSPLDFPRKAILTEVDEDGNILNSRLYNARNADETQCWSIAINAAQTKLYIGGDMVPTVNATTPFQTLMHISQIDYGTQNVDWSHAFGGNNGTSPLGGNRVQKIIVHPTTGKVYATGMISMPGDNVETPIANSDALSTVIQRNKDIFITTLTPGANNTFTVDYLKTFDKSSVNYPAAQIHNEAGPFTARTMLSNNTNEGPYEYSDAKYYLEENLNQDERAYDLEFTQDGNLALVALVNFIGTYGYSHANGSELFYSNKIYGNNNVVYDNTGFHDLGRPLVANPSSKEDYYFYDEYTDGDGYLLKINIATGNLLWSKNVSHFSSKDFYPQLLQNTNGNYIISGSTADYIDNYNPNDPKSYEQPLSYDALVMETPDDGTSDNLWRRTVKGGWNKEDDYLAGQDIDDHEQNMCCFCLAPAADGGFLVGGDCTPYEQDAQGRDQASPDQDYFSISKLSPYCYNTTPFAINQKDYSITGNETWPNSAVPNNANIAARVIVEAGATLTISNATLHFASSDHFHDFYQWPSSVDDANNAQMSGIVVRPGGKLIVQGSTLRGMEDCQRVAANDRYMWDGIVVQGDPNGAPNPAAGIQGILTITNSNIEDARIGTMVDYAFRYRMVETKNTSSTGTGGATDYTANTRSTRYNPVGWAGGGIVQAQNSTWKDCRFAVKYQQVVNKGPFAWNYYTDCKFTATPDGMGDPCFYASPTGSRLPASTMFNNGDAGTIALKGNTFSCDPGFPREQWPAGVYGPNGSFYIGKSNTQQSVFRNLGIGVWLSYDPLSGAKPSTIVDNVFENNTASIDVANSANGLTVRNNSFALAPYTLTTPQTTGIRLQASTGYDVSNNSFDRISGSNGWGYIGIQSSWGSSTVNYDDRIRNNTFNNLQGPSIALQRNSSADDRRGLQWTCNDYLGGNAFSIVRLSTDQQNLTMVPATMRVNQGYCDQNTSNPAENRFYTACTLSSIPTDRLAADNDVTQTVNYYYASNSSYPELNPLCYTSQYIASVCSNPGDPAAFCNPSNPNGPDYPNEAKAELLQVSGQKGNTTPGTEEWYSLNTREHLVVSALCRHYGSNGAPDSAGDLLMSYNRPTEALPFYAMSGNWTAAEAAWSALPADSQEDVQYKQMARAALDLYSAGQSWKDASDSIKNGLLALSSNNTRTGSLALAVTDLLELKPYVWPIAALATSSGAMAKQAPTTDALPSITSVTSQTAFKLYPNPTTSAFTLESAKGGKATLYSVLGVKVWQQIVSVKETVQLPKTLSSGAYLLRFEGRDGNSFQTRLVYQP